MREQMKSSECMASGFEPQTFCATLDDFGSVQIVALSWAAKPRKASGNRLAIAYAVCSSQANLFSNLSASTVASSFGFALRSLAGWSLPLKAMRIQTLLGQRLACASARLAFSRSQGSLCPLPPNPSFNGTPGGAR